MSGLFDEYCKTYNIPNKEVELKRLQELFGCLTLGDVESNIHSLGLIDSKVKIFDISERYDYYDFSSCKLNANKDNTCLHFVFSELGLAVPESLPERLFPRDLEKELITAIVNSYKENSTISDYSVVLKCYNKIVSKIKVTVESSLARMLVHHSSPNSFKVINDHYTVVCESLNGETISPPVTTIYFYSKLDITGITTLPKCFKVKDIPLSNILVKSNVMVKDGVNAVINVNGDVVIESACPIQCEGDVIIRGTGTLILTSTETRQPCIGPLTCNNMSYGRWSRSASKINKIIIDGVHVICESRVPNFSIGTYGFDYIPEISLLNGAILDCPETKGERLVSYNATAPEGSTKISEDMQYILVKSNQSWVDSMSDDYKDIYHRLLNIDTEAIRIVPGVSLKALKLALSILSVNPNLDVSYLYKPGISDHSLYIFENMIYLRMPFKDYKSEWVFEVEKYDYIVGVALHSLPNSLDIVTSVRVIIHYIIKNNKENVTAYVKKLLYNLIPSYNWHFSHSEDYYSDDVLKFLGDTSDLDKYLYLINSESIKRVWGL